MLGLIALGVSFATSVIVGGKIVYDRTNTPGSNGSANGDGGSGSDVLPDAGLRVSLQNQIYLLLSDVSFLDWATHLKTGGARGVPVEKETFRTVVLHKAYEALGILSARPYGEHDFPLWNNDYPAYNLISPNAFYYPGEDLLVNEETTSGFERDRPDIWEQITGWVENSIACVATVVGGAAATVASGGTLSLPAIGSAITACRNH